MKRLSRLQPPDTKTEHAPQRENNDATRQTRNQTIRPPQENPEEGQRLLPHQIQALPGTQEAVERGLKFAYSGRKQKKRQYRSLWIVRINAEAKINEISILAAHQRPEEQAGVELDRKVLADLAVNDAPAFTALCGPGESRAETGCRRKQSISRGRPVRTLMVPAGPFAERSRLRHSPLARHIPRRPDNIPAYTVSFTKTPAMPTPDPNPAQRKPGSATYADAGVDISAGDRTKQRIKYLAQRTFTRNVLGEIGGFGGLFKLDGKYQEPVLVSSADGVGTKLKLAFQLGIHHTVGIDLVNHCVNDIAVLGATPLFFLDYLASGKLDRGADNFFAGFSKACRATGCALIGGETAQMPGFYADGEYDLAGFIVGVVERAKADHRREDSCG